MSARTTLGPAPRAAGGERHPVARQVVVGQARRVEVEDGGVVDQVVAVGEERQVAVDVELAARHGGVDEGGGDAVGPERHGIEVRLGARLLVDGDQRVALEHQLLAAGGVVLERGRHVGLEAAADLLLARPERRVEEALQVRGRRLPARPLVELDEGGERLGDVVEDPLVAVGGALADRHRQREAAELGAVDGAPHAVRRPRTEVEPRGAGVVGVEGVAGLGAGGTGEDALDPAGQHVVIAGDWRGHSEYN